MMFLYAEMVPNVPKGELKQWCMVLKNNMIWFTYQRNCIMSNNDEVNVVLLIQSDSFNFIYRRWKAEEYLCYSNMLQKDLELIFWY